MGIPQILMIIIFTINIVREIMYHGIVEKEIVSHNAFATIFSTAVIVGILYAGGFWSQ